MEKFQSLPGSSACEQLFFSLSQGLFSISGSHVFPQLCEKPGSSRDSKQQLMSLTGLIPVSLDRALQTSGNVKVIWGTFCFVSCSFVRSGKAASVLGVRS